MITLEDIKNISISTWIFSTVFIIMGIAHASRGEYLSPATYLVFVLAFFFMDIVNCRHMKFMDRENKKLDVLINQIVASTEKMESRKECTCQQHQKS